MHTTPIRALVGIAAAACLTIASRTHGESTFLPMPGGFQASINAPVLSGDGSTLAGTSVPGPGAVDAQAWRWSRDLGAGVQWAPAPVAGAQAVSVTSMSIDGRAIAGSYSIPPGAFAGWRWDAGSGAGGGSAASLAGPVPGSTLETPVISGDGQSVFGVSGGQAVRMGPGSSSTLLPLIAGSVVVPTAASHDGQAAAGLFEQTPATLGAFRWTQTSGATPITGSFTGGGSGGGAGGGTSVTSVIMSADGAVVAGSAQSASLSRSAWRAGPDGVAAPLPLLPDGQAFQPSAMNADGSLMLGFAADFASSHVWLQASGGPGGAFVRVEDFLAASGQNLAGFTTALWFDCSDDGRTFVGLVTRDIDQAQGWLVVSIPGAGTPIVIVGGLCWLLPARRRR